MKKYTRKIVSLLLSAGMLFSAVPSSFILSSIVVVAESDTEEVHIWDGTSDVSWYDDEDTEFHISTPEQLAGLSELVNTGKTMDGKTFILDNDLYLNDVSAYDEWKTTPPENTFEPLSQFNGSILGNGYRIIGLYKFGFIKNMNEGYISNLHFEDMFITETYSYFGGLVCSSYNSKIVDCTIQGDVEAICNTKETLIKSSKL